MLENAVIIKSYMVHGFHKNIKQHNCLFFYKNVLSMIENISKAENQHIRMISEVSCDNED